ncbi:4-hydroxy-tetrahydrodipicolinate reductase [Galbibacter pacificus]|uniref:4-hydroxy-tetrahydrodipicolinate reductase n=1 Tax=Galbibacter pacificus TaxID=2996052 RepID=A0ABT6FPD1_9FLAO|nr:4-hydroxy-tetrahydrodipicolinate reductase [Galbibacter pacificus]MDG3581441.1 4-hydroxy-tetrahydrodipicolinate reductase [Galbibacter pacificus]MDG3584919.1 4-hydroxy-tetrahydrodipicolinate reductase [Galbibacter pacificus]
MIKVFIAGGTGWAGSALSKGVFNHEKMELVGALSRSHKGENLAEILDLGSTNIPIYENIETALDETDFDVLVDYTKPDVAKKNILTSLKKGKKVVVGTSGLTEKDYSEIEKVANENKTSVLAVGNFAITVVLLQKFSEMAAKYIPNFEIIDYTHEDKIDAPSGTARELAHRLSKVQKPNKFVTEDELIGDKSSRGANLNDVQIHSVRLPGHVISIETIFGLKDEKLSIRHDSGASAVPYVKGGLLAIEKIGTFKGLRRGLDSIMDF